jgi:hypothetical protein
MFNKKSNTGAMVIALGIAAAMINGAAAQTAPDAAQNSLDQRLNVALGGSTSTRDGLTALVTGYEDLILLEPRQFFTVSFDISPQHSSNLALSPEAESGTYWVGNFGVRAATRLADRVNVHASVGALQARYRSHEELDYSAFTGSLGADMDVATRLGKLKFGLDYAPASIYQGSFSDHQQTRQRIVASAQLINPLPHHAALVSNLQVERVLADPADFKSYGESLDVALVMMPHPAWQVAASIGYNRRQYDSYFVDLVGVDRKDHGWRGALSAQWSPGEWVTVALSLDYSRNTSTSDVNGYKAFTIAPAVTLSARF